jgi:hypothetical protein
VSSGTGTPSPKTEHSGDRTGHESADGNRGKGLASVLASFFTTLPGTNSSMKSPVISHLPSHSTLPPISISSSWHLAIGDLLLRRQPRRQQRRRYRHGHCERNTEQMSLAASWLAISRAAGTNWASARSGTRPSTAGVRAVASPMSAWSPSAQAAPSPEESRASSLIPADDSGNAGDAVAFVHDV